MSLTHIGDTVAAAATALDHFGRFLFLRFFGRHVVRLVVRRDEESEADADATLLSLTTMLDWL